MDDQNALNWILKNEGWFENYALEPFHRNYYEAEKEGAIFNRRFVTRFFEQPKAVSGHIYFKDDMIYQKNWTRLYNLSSDMLQPTLVHGNGQAEKEKAFEKVGLWFVDKNGGCKALS